MTYNFSGKRALVTGAGAGIGRALSLRLAELGAEVIALSKTQANLDSLAKENPSIKTVCVDLTDWDASREAVGNLVPIHLLVNNAATALLSPMLDATPEDFDMSFNLNVKAIMNVTQVVTADLITRKQPGSVVNLSSQAGQRGIRDHLIYCATKAAVDSFTKTMALELGSKGIRVNAVCPTVVMTEMGKIGWSSKEKAASMIARIPQGKFAEVEDVVNAIVYLLSNSSDMVNGHLLPVDGGFLCH